MSDDTEADTGPVNITNGLTDQQQRGAELAAAGWSGVNIAAELGVRQETVSRWRKLPAWQAAVDAITGEVRAEISGRLMDLSQAALDELEQLIHYKFDSSLRLRACIAMLQLSGVGRAITPKTGVGRTEAA